RSRQYGRVLAEDRGVRRIHVRFFACGIPVDPDETRVETADSAAAIAHQLLVEAADVDAQIRLFDVFGRETGEPRELLRNRALLVRGDLVAFHQRGRVFAEGETLRFGDDGFDAGLLQIGGQALVIPGGCRVCRQEEDVRQVVSAVEA